MSIVEGIKAKAKWNSFRPSFIGIVISPVYIIRSRLYRAIREFAPLITGKVLDFGCGSKPYELLFTQSNQYIGVDLEVTGHDHTTSKIDVYYDGTILPFPDGEFDAVIAFEVFEHIFNLPEVLSEIRRVTKDNGQLLISIPFAWSEHEIPYDYARYTSFGIKHLLEANGYTVASIRKTTSSVLAIAQLHIAYLMQLFPRVWVIRKLIQLCVIFPCTVFAYIANAVLPHRDDFFCNCVILARKSSEVAVASGSPVGGK